MIIGLGCQKRVGKDTVADYLVSNHGFIKKSFANPLKLLCSYMESRYRGELTHADYLILSERWRHMYANGSQFSFAMDVCRQLADTGTYGNISISNKDETGKCRQLLQFVGTDLFRAVDDHFWIRAMTHDLLLIPGRDVVIPDVRFPNEKEFIETAGYAIRICRDLPLEDCHLSEIALVDAAWRYYIFNISTIENLYEQVEDLLVVLGEEERV